MDYAQQFHSQATQHAQHPPHLQGAYPSTSQNSVPGGVSITSPPPAQAQLHSHTAHGQASPILPSQTHSLQAAQNQPTHPLHQQISYPQAYAVGPQGMHAQYGVSPAQAAAMAATAAASGQGYYPLPGEGGLPTALGQEARASPAKGIKQERGQRSPQQVQGQMVGPQTLPSQVQAQQQIPGNRRMSQQIGSPGMQNSQAMNHAAGPARASVPPQMPPAPQPPVQQHQQSPEIVAGGAEESPLYVNAKQFHRILKRRVARQRLEEALRLTSKGRKPYLHESRHNHAMRRPRGPGGRFLTADEVAEMERQKNVEGGGDHSGDKENANATQTPAKNNTHQNAASSTGGSNKRKASAMVPDTATPIKRSKVSGSTLGIGGGQPRRSSSAEESEDLEDEDDGDDG
ncbi:MAG: Transcriptional activator [Geoglossum simile]|nr:MAG: Transcriptional activator [Geoglossum simile]